MKISALNVYNYNNIVFKGNKSPKKNLFHTLKKRFHTSNEVFELIDKRDEEERYLGSLPVNWVRAFKPEEIKDKTTEIFHIFSDFATDAISTENHVYSKEEDFPLLKLKYRLDKEINTDTKIEYIGSGDYGRVYRIQALDEDVALKIYYSDMNNKLLKAFHGNPMEISNAIALNHTLKPNQCSKFYCAKISQLDEKDGFMLTKFVEPDNKKYPPLTPFDYSRFLYMDANRNRGENFIGGRLIDYGDIRQKFPNHEQQQMAKQLLPFIKKKDIEGIKSLNDKFSDNKEWKKYLQGTTALFQRKVKEPAYFAMYIAPNLTKTDIQMYSFLGVDFSAIEEYDYSKTTPENIQALKNLGFNI